MILVPSTEVNGDGPDFVECAGVLAGIGCGAHFDVLAPFAVMGIRGGNLFGSEKNEKAKRNSWK